MSKPKYLSKSRFKVGYECPAKLYYNERSKVYGNKNNENEFLKALAHGGFQVGALAKLYFPEGIDLESCDTETAIQKTNELLLKKNTTIFEAAIQTGPYLVRVDVLVKKGNNVELIEVKSKSFHKDEIKGKDDKLFFKKRDPGIASEWEPYLVDVAYQTWVLKTAHPDWTVEPYLMLADKDSRVTIEGLHQNFRLIKAPSPFATGQTTTKVLAKKNFTPTELGEPILKRVPVSDAVEYLTDDEIYPTGEHLPEFAAYLAKNHVEGTKGICRINSLCKSCEFRIDESFKSRGYKSGFEECWLESKKITEKDLKRNFIFDIWFLKKSEDLLSRNKLFFEDVSLDDLKPKKATPSKEKRLLMHDRQWLQVERTVKNIKEPYIDLDGFKKFFKELKFPVHCIDFETAMVAIPFHPGRRPYEQLAFQFSHHIWHEDGRIEHADQYIDLRPGRFPNFDFVRALKQALDKDDGTILRYSYHENTVLRQICDQLTQLVNDSKDPQLKDCIGDLPKDAVELVNFIGSITQPRKSKRHEAGLKVGERNMIDLREVVVDLYYHPLMGGSNSIKKVIPAVLAESKFLQEKYSKPIYGKGLSVPSLNFEKMQWITFKGDGTVSDPYKMLPPVFPKSESDPELKDLDLIFDAEDIADGGAATTAWSRMQFTEMTDNEREAIATALLKYCELDTLSMVWLLEYWRGLI